MRIDQSRCVYQFSCQCDSPYVGSTSQRLQDRIKQNIPLIYPLFLFFSEMRTSCPSMQIFNQLNTQSLASDLAIGLHLLQNVFCPQHYNGRRFYTLAQGRSRFHLSALEAAFIKTSNPFLCRQTNLIIAERLYTNDDLSLVFFLPITARFFDINSRSFPALSILTILLDKCQSNPKLLWKTNHFDWSHFRIFHVKSS